MPSFSRENPEHKPKKLKTPNQPPALKPWESRPWPTKGTPSQMDLHTAVGIAVDRWERLDGSFGTLFALTTSPRQIWSMEASYVYSAIRTFEGRLALVRASGEGYFATHPTATFQDTFRKVYGEALNFAGRRNEIAHSVVEFFRPVDWFENPSEINIYPLTFSIWPSNSSGDKRPYKARPSYTYTSVEIDYFSDQFHLLFVKLLDLIMSVDRHNASLYDRGERQVGP